jgi:SAM-dependent methyltransferase
MDLPEDQFYTGLVADAYAALRGSPSPSEPYLRFVRKWGEPGLELGCGHGEPLLDLVAAGLDVVGLDSSADMLRLCGAAALDRGVSVRLLHQRMQDLSVDVVFRSMYLAGPTFQLLTSGSDARVALERMRAHLHLEGRVLIPTFFPAPAHSADLGVWREYTDEHQVVRGFRTIDERRDEAQRRTDFTVQYRRGPAESPDETVDRVWSLRWYEPGEFEQLANEAGLAVDRVYAQPDGDRSFVLKHSDS